MKIILSAQVLVCILGSLFLQYFNASNHALSYFCGSGMLLLSIFLMGIGWGLIFQKKLIALAVSVIVFKYAILGIIIFTIVGLPWFNPLWFAIGVASFVMSAIIYAIAETLKEGNENVI
jgi:hypothetical protein